MNSPLRVDRVLGDRPFAEVGEPALAVADEGRGLLAVAGTHQFGAAPVGVYDVGDLGCRAVVRSRDPVHAMAFHPVLALLAVGTGGYDGGYFFRGELLLMDLETGTAVSLIEHQRGRQVLALEWLSAQELRILMAPPDDWQDEAARVEGHVAVVRREDWRAVAPRSISRDELAGPRVAAPRSEGREDAHRVASNLSGAWDPRREVRAVEELSDGRILATLHGIQAESWLPSGDRQWTVADDKGGREIVVAPDERSVWVSLWRREGEDRPQSLVRLSLEDGVQLEDLTPSFPASLVRCADGMAALAPAGHGGDRGRLRIRHGRRIYYRETDSERKWALEPGEVWLAAAELRGSRDPGRPREPGKQEFHRLYPYAWTPEETHFAGPGVETTDGGLVYAGTVYDGQGLQPGGSFVVRRGAASGEPRWVFRTDREATDLDADTQNAYVAYDNGEIVALDLVDGAVNWRWQTAVGAVHAKPTALTVTGPGRLLIGTSDGRILVCSTE